MQRHCATVQQNTHASALARCNDATQVFERIRDDLLAADTSIAVVNLVGCVCRADGLASAAATRSPRALPVGAPPLRDGAMR